MKYYTINKSNDLKVIGYYPQTLLKDDYNPNLKNGHWNLKFDQFADFELSYELTLNKKAKATNYLDGYDNNFGIIIDAKFKQLLEGFKLPPHRFYPIKVHQNNEILIYYWFHYIIEDFWDLLNPEKSFAEVVKVEGTSFSVQNKIPIKTFEQIKEEENKYIFPYNVRIGQIKMKSFFKYDFYQINSLSYNMIFSEPLMQALRKNKITGFVSKEFDRFSVIK